MGKTYYEASARPADERTPLAGDIRVDTCVVGAGLTGLSAALTLARSGARVVVLESGRAGSGASGRNGGQLIPGSGMARFRLSSGSGRKKQRPYSR